MRNEDSTVWVTFNGEIYNFPELRQELEGRGHRFRSRSDTEVIVHGYEEWGDACVERLWGMFAFALWDTRRRRMLIARDRFGKKPLNYIVRGETIAVASEIPALLATGLSEKRLDLASLGLFWNLQYIPAPGSSFSDIRKLPAGHAMAWEGNRVRTWRYYPPADVTPFRGTPGEAEECLRSVVNDAVRRRLVSDVPVGVALSGGIDSALIAVMAKRTSTSRLMTLTVRPHLEDNSYDEGRYARLTAEGLGAEHHEIRPEPVLLESLGQVISNLGEPFAIASSIPCYYLFKALKQRATVVLTGDGGDENFGGYGYYRHLHLQSLAKVMWPVWAMAYRTLGEVYRLIPSARSWLKSGMAVLRFAQGLPLSEARWEAVRVLRPEAARAWVDGNALKSYAEKCVPHLSETDPTRRRMLSDQFDSMCYHILTKVDITSMAHGVEVRSPLLDHRLADFARSLPLHYLIRRGEGKVILRQLLRGEVPTEVIEKPKTGFGLPLREHFAGSGRNYLTDVLTSPNSTYDVLVNRGEIGKIIDSHCHGRPYQTGLLLKLLVLRLWLEQTKASM
jgi:asparagine synthase (glutamine-hydrolysing)